MFILNRATMRKPFVDGLAYELELLSFSSSWLHWELANWLRPPLKCQTKEWSVWSANLSTGNWALHSRLARAFWKLFVLCMCKRCLIWGMKAWVLGRTVSLLQITCLISNHSTYSSTLSTPNSTVGSSPTISPSTLNLHIFGCIWDWSFLFWLIHYYGPKYFPSYTSFPNYLVHPCPDPYS